MEGLTGLLIAAAGGLLLGAALGYAFGRQRAGELRGRLEQLAARAREDGAQLAELRASREALRADAARLEQRLREREERLTWTEEARGQLREAFEALSARVLRSNAEEYLQRTREQLEGLLARARGDWRSHQQELSGLMAPVAVSLDKLDGEIRELEAKRQKAYGELEGHLSQLAASQGQLYDAARKLEQSLRSPVARGRWGELELRRVVELAGMQEGIHFVEQKGGEEGRPDLLVFLPHGGLLPVDAKAPMNAYFDSFEAADEASRRARLGAHARALRGHVARLGQKAYFEQFERAPELVILFLPSPAAMSAAFERDPEILDFAMRNRVLPTSPVELLALLKAVAYGWQQQNLTEGARELVAEAQELFERLSVFLQHHALVGKDLERAVAHYNDSVGSYERRLRPALERVAERGVRLKEREQPARVDHRPSPPEPPELPDAAGRERRLQSALPTDDGARER